MKDSRGGLTKEEEKELEDINNIVRNALKEVEELRRNGVSLEQGDRVLNKGLIKSNERLELNKKEMPKKKLTVSERRAEVLRLIEEYKIKGYNEKQIIKNIRADLGVSYTYVYNLVKERGGV